MSYINGYARVITHPDKDLCLIQDIHFNSPMLYDYDERTFIEEVMNQIDCRDSIILVTFKYESLPSGTPWDGIEYSDSYTVVSHFELNKSYKNEWKQSIMEEYKNYQSIPFDNLEESNKFLKEIETEKAEWEDFYEEDITIV